MIVGNKSDLNYNRKVESNQKILMRKYLINYSIKYHPNTPLVLKHLNIEIKLMEKIGVVGRSGKSTLCLFKILEATEGKITIDDVDINTISLKN